MNVKLLSDTKVPVRKYMFYNSEPKRSFVVIVRYLTVLVETFVLINRDL